MTTALKIGQSLKGAKDVYSVVKQLNDTIWTASSTNCPVVVLKTTLEGRLHREQDALQRFIGHPSIRQLVDRVEDPPVLVLEHLEVDALEASGEERLARADIKFIAKNILEALKSLHEEGIAHTDVKPDNVLLNFGKDAAGVVEAKLADCGEAWHVGYDVNPKGEAHHIIGAAIFRSPEAMMQVKWATPTDIWSFGATLMSLIWGKHFHIFKPDKVQADEEVFPLHVVIEQARYFGPFPLSYLEFIDADQTQTLDAVHQHIEDRNLRKPFILVQDKELTTEDKEFICRVMALDPRDRPTARQLLADKWFKLP